MGGHKGDTLPFFLLAGFISPFLQALPIVALAIGSVEQNLSFRKKCGVGHNPAAGVPKPWFVRFLSKNHRRCFLSCLVVTLTGSGKRRKILIGRAEPGPFQPVYEYPGAASAESSSRIRRIS
jgi:hypothetical protein